MEYCIDTKLLKRTIRPFFKRSYQSIELISVGIVCEDGRELYLISNEFSIKGCDPALLDALIKPLIQDYVKPSEIDWANSGSMNNNVKAIQYVYGNTNEYISKKIYEFISHRHYTITTDQGDKAIDGNGNPIKIWSHYPEIDAVMLQSLFKDKMPREFPKAVSNLKKFILDNGLVHSPEYKEFLKVPVKYNALEEAKSTYAFYKLIQKRIAQNNGSIFLEDFHFRQLQAHEYWYYFGKCTPYPVQIPENTLPRKPYHIFTNQKDCQEFIDKDLKGNTVVAKSVCRCSEQVSWIRNDGYCGECGLSRLPF